MSATWGLLIPESELGEEVGRRRQKAVAQRYLVAPPGHIQCTWHWRLTDREATGLSPPWEEPQGIHPAEEGDSLEGSGCVFGEILSE